MLICQGKRRPTAGGGGEMFPLRCLSLLLLLAGVVFVRSDSPETLIETSGDELDVEDATEAEQPATTAESDDNELRNLNKDYDRLGKIYVAQYYTYFDDPSRRLALVALYHSEESFLSFEGEKFRGTKKILEKFETMALGKIERSINSVDSQPLRDGGLIVNVVGKVKAKEERERLYAQTFVFKPQKGSFFLQHDIFRTIRA